MNRAERRAGRRSGHVCEHGNLMKTGGDGEPMCPHRCGFIDERTCRYCGSSTQQILQMNGGWRCRSANYCQRRIRQQIKDGK